MRNSILCLLLVLCGEVSAQFKNVKLTDLKDSTLPFSVGVAINEREPNNIVAVIPNLSIHSSDAGATWTQTKIHTDFGAVNTALLADSKGHFYYFHTAALEGIAGSVKQDRIVCQKTLDGGKTWSPEYFAGLTPGKNNDHPFAATHAKKNMQSLTWTQFDQLNSSDANCQTNIMLSMSSGGDKWSKPIQISQNPGDCKNGNATVQNSTSAISTDNKIFIAWSNNEKIYLDRSYDGGDMWLTNDLFVGKQAGGAILNIPGFGPCDNGPILNIDNTISRYHNSLYMIWADQKNGVTDTDIWFMRSTNRGDYWTSPARINKDAAGNHQFMPSATVDQASGFIYVMYYDRRDHNNNETDVYLAYSMDGGNHFNEVKISESPFTPVEPFHGDTQISAYRGEIVPVWIRDDAGGASVWTTVIKESSLKK